MPTLNPEHELRHAIVKLGIEPKCLGTEELFVDYVSPPTRVEARALCRGCPLLQLCDAAARHRKPAWGVWGGRVYGAQKKVSRKRAKPLDMIDGNAENK